MYAQFRPRRLDESTRRRYQQIFLTPSDFIWPIFIVDGQDRKEPIPSMTDVYRWSADRVIPEIETLMARGLTSILIFGVPEHKGLAGAAAPDNLAARAVSVLRKAFPSLEIITDVCLCSYTEDGHCHVGDNDATCQILAEMAVSHARAGASLVAPSDMMDKRVGVIRQALDQHGFQTVPILSYAAKFASSFYGPFREAADCTPQQGDRKQYQMDYHNPAEAMWETDADIAEGAAQIMVKPALTYLDIVAATRNRYPHLPIVAYNVSGEYQMIRTMIDTGQAKPDLCYETLVAIKRAGANRIVSYWTPTALAFLSGTGFSR